MIKFGKPKVEVVKDKAVLTCDVKIEDTEKEIFYEIDKEYKDYLCTERSDAFVIASLYYAMKHNHDIVSDVPMTSSIYYTLTTYLMPTLAKHSNSLHIIKIKVPITEEVLETKGAVGAGMSCGVDSFHTLKNYLNPEIPSMKLTHLFFNNVGSFKAYAEKYHGIGSDIARDQIMEKAKEVAKEVKLPLIITNTNIHIVFSDMYYRVHTFANMFSVFIMQKFLSKYYYASSGYDLAYYTVKDTPELDSAEYDLLIFYCLSTSNLKIYTEGAEKTRLEKTIDIADFRPAQNHLHVCIKDSDNCGRCLKCRRTLVSLEAIGKLDNFKNVFNLDYYNKHKEDYYNWLEQEAEKGSEMNKYTYQLLKQKYGKSEYSDVEEFNNKNIILPETVIDSISMKDDKKYILNKNKDERYVSEMYCRLYFALQIAKEKNKTITIPRYLLKNNGINFLKEKSLKKKYKALETIIRKRTKELELHDLAYFVLYKRKTSKQISKYLVKNKYIQDLKDSSLAKTITTKALIDIIEQVINNKYLNEALTEGALKYEKSELKNRNIILNCKNTYYKNCAYKVTYLEIKNNRYFFTGQIDNYFVSFTARYRNKNDIYEDITTIYGMIKRLKEQ